MQSKNQGRLNRWPYGALAATLASVAMSTHAATFTVTNLNDSGAGSLRQALADANANTADADTINITVNGTITLTSGQLNIHGPVTIVGPGADKLTIDGNANSRIFSAFPIAELTAAVPTCPNENATNFSWELSGVKLTNARRLTSAGGAIFTFHTLTVRNVDFVNNTSYRGSAISANLRFAGQSVTVENAVITGNKSLANGTDASFTSRGAISVYDRCTAAPVAATVTIRNANISGNEIDNAVTNSSLGAGISVFAREAAVTIVDSEIVGNRIVVPTPTPTAGYLGGGANLESKTLLIDRTEISNNSARNSSGLYVGNSDANFQTAANRMAITIRNTTISGNRTINASGGVAVIGNADATFKNVTIANNTQDAEASASVLFGGLNNTVNGVTVPMAIPTVSLDSTVIQRSATGGAATYVGLAALQTVPNPASTQNITNSYIDSKSGSITINGSGNVIGGDPRLLPLADNGNGTRTHAPAANSPLIGAGSASTETTDQRGTGYGRVVDGKTDIGAHQTKALSDVVEFYNTPLNHYFVTASASEASGIDSGAAGAGWSRTGKTWKSWALGEAGSNPVCRFYAFTANSHFYTADKGECDYVNSLNPNKEQPKGWILEGNAYNVVVPTAAATGNTCPDGLKPLYRLFNRAFEIAGKTDSNHRYTTDTAVVTEMVGKGWKDEKVVMCVK